MSRQKQKIYLDHSATTPVDDRVLEAMLPYFTRVYGNASSIHNFGQEAKVGLEEARRQVASVLRAEPAEIVFTSGGTESNNWALKGAAAFFQGKKNHIVTNKAEHHAVLNTTSYLRKQGLEVTFVPVDETGMVAAERVADAIRPETFLVSVMHSNNEVGALNPIREIGQICREGGVLLHTDAVQSFGKLPLHVNDLNVDMLSLSAHKIYGPKGAGALFMRQGLQLDKLLHGGKHERDRRAGTENVPGAIGLGKAAEIAAENMEQDMAKQRNLSETLRQKVLSEINGVYPNGNEKYRHPAIINLSFEGTAGDSLLLSLDLEGIAVSNGSACTSGTVEPSHVLQAMGLPKSRSNSAIRFSFGRQNSEEEIDLVVDSLKRVVTRLRRLNRN